MTQGGLSDLVWLAGTEARNRTTAMAARLRSPRYLVAFLVGLGYFVFLFAPQLVPGSEARIEPPSWAPVVAPVGLAALVLFWWVRGGYDRVLAFRPEEVHFLFPAPLSRTTLIRYRVIRAQGGVIITALMVTLFGRGSLPWYLVLPAAWAVVSTLHLHQVGSSLVRVTAFQRGVTGLRRVAVPVVLAAALGGVLLWTLASAVRAARSADGLESAGAAVLASLTTPLAEAALLPFALLVGPLFATTPVEWVIGLAGALGLLVLHLLWVIRSDAAFEEAAAEAGRLRAEIIAAARSGGAWWRVGKKEDQAVRRRVRIPLAPTGEPALAIAWHQLVGLVGDARLTLVAIILIGLSSVFAVLAWASGSLAGAALSAAAMSVMLGGMAFLFGPLVLRHDLRRDLARVEVLRTYPLDPRDLLLAEMAAPVAILTAVELALLGFAAAMLVLGAPDGEFVRLALLVGLVVVANTPGILALQVAIQNGIALLFPGWVSLGAGSQGGVDAVGQGIIAVIAAMFVLAALLVPPTLGALAVGAAYGAVIPSWGAVAAAVTFTGAVWVEVFWLARRLAAVYDRLDAVEAGLLH